MLVHYAFHLLSQLCILLGILVYLGFILLLQHVQLLSQLSFPLRNISVDLFQLLLVFVLESLDFLSHLGLKTLFDLRSQTQALLFEVLYELLLLTVVLLPQCLAFFLL